MALRWGILSAGRISHDYIVGLNALPEADHKVVAVAARSLQEATKFAQEHNIPTAYGSYEELAKDSQVDVVYIGTITACHKDATLMMFNNGKPVLCEKSLTACPEDTAALIQASREKQLFLMEAAWTRCFPAIKELRRQIAAGVIGEVKYVQANLGFRLPPGKSLPDHMTDPKLKGSCMLEVGVYPVNFATMIFGERPESVEAKGWLTETGVEEFAAITLKYSGERVAQLSCSFNLNLPNDACVVGTEGMLRLPQTFWCPSKLETPAGVLEFPLPEASQPTNFVNSVGLCYEAEEVKQCICEGKIESEAMPLEHSQIVSDIIKIVVEKLGSCIYQS